VEQNNAMTPAAQAKGRWKLLAVIAVCAAPMIASYVTYYVIKPQSRTNFGALIDPRNYPIPALGITTLDGKPTGLDAFKGKWIMLQVGPSDCQATCHEQLLAMRQQRLMQGKEMERLERVWLITDAAPLDTTVMREFDGTRMLRVDAAAVTKWLPVDAGGNAADHMYLVDPLGNLMMRFPKGAESSIEARSKVKKDIGKLLKASAIG
jgi:hypothetical protein